MPLARVDARSSAGSEHRGAPDAGSADDGSGGADIWTIVVAGGSGVRFGQPKQYELIGERRVIDIGVATACSSGVGVVLVVPAGDLERERARAGDPRVVVIAGGPTRAASVRAGLTAVPSDAAIVCVHDAARPFATEELFSRVVAAVREGADGAVPGLPVTDTIKRVDAGVVIETPARAALVAVQTPQAFRAAMLRSAHRTGADATDDAALVEAAGGRVVVVEGELHNRKITHPEDLEWARSLRSQHTVGAK